MSIRIRIALLFAPFAILSVIAHAQTEIGDVPQLRNELAQAKERLESKRLIAASESVNRCVAAIGTVVAKSSPRERQELSNLHQDLRSLRERLAIEGAEIRELPPWSELAPKEPVPEKSPPANPPADPPPKPEMPMESNSNAPPQNTFPAMKGPVSFARDIAPLLTANCNGCHFNARQVRGGLNINTFTLLLKGGSSGSMVMPGRGEGSLLVRKLRGTEGQRMPAGGRPALSEANIQLVVKWIDQGAQFDGENRDAQLDIVTSKAWASNASQEEIQQQREKRARDKWRAGLPTIAPEELSTDHFHVIGNVGEEGVKKVLEAAESAESQLRKQFSIRSKDPLIKGGITVFAFKQRYDYSEFGRMVEKRPLPDEWSGHWKSDIVDAYVTLVYDPSNPKINETSLLQHLASVWIQSHEGTPRWFADGVGRQTLAQVAGAKDARVQAWLKKLPESINKLTDVKSLLEGKVNDEDSATIGFGIVRFMSEGNSKRQYDTLLRTVASGTPFDQVMERTFGPVEPFLKQLLRKAK